MSSGGAPALSLSVVSLFILSLSKCRTSRMDLPFIGGFFALLSPSELVEQACPEFIEWNPKYHWVRGCCTQMSLTIFLLSGILFAYYKTRSFTKEHRTTQISCRGLSRQFAKSPRTPNTRSRHQAGIHRPILEIARMGCSQSSA